MTVAKMAGQMVVMKDKMTVEQMVETMENLLVALMDYLRVVSLVH